MATDKYVLRNGVAVKVPGSDSERVHATPVPIVAAPSMLVVEGGERGEIAVIHYADGDVRLERVTDGAWTLTLGGVVFAIASKRGRHRVRVVLAGDDAPREAPADPALG